MPSTPPSTSPIQADTQRIIRTPISSPVSRSQPQSPSQLIHTPLSTPAFPLSSKDHTVRNTPVVGVPLTPPDSSGKTLVLSPLGDPIHITTPNPTKTEATPLANKFSDTSNVSPSRVFQSPSRRFFDASTVSHSPAGSVQKSCSSDTGFFPSQSDASVDSAASITPPNVYINGLPPNFPEEQLYNMTKEFGPIISVRTFTRHVSEKPTGYGFVLFESLDSAEKCIDTLRKYRNLHPSLSKQVHKIPGTAYAHVEDPEDSQADAEAMSDSFKARMEKFKDDTSSNLYIEGLPLSIDEPTLGALMSPYKIMSSRLFQTRLSHPPRIIAFVRLENRSGAEEIVERLHGRMVRGWNDPGCRISVRFADTAEQREIRRQERTIQGGEHHSPARLTIAQAALLNLQGSQALPKHPQRGSRDHYTGSPLSQHLPPPVAHQLPKVSAKRRSKRREAVPDLLSNATAHDGYTPAEELIFAAHAEQQFQARGLPGISGRGYELRDVVSSQNPHISSRASGVPGINHALPLSHPRSQAMAYDRVSRQQKGYGYEDVPENAIERLPLDFQGLSVSRFQSRGQQHHLRSTTVPSPVQNNRSRTFTGYDAYGNNSKPPPPMNTAASKSSINIITHNSYRSSPHNTVDRNSVSEVSSDLHYNDKGDSIDSPLVSPALTYSSHGRTPQTLSPATPFFGSFLQGETFEGLPIVGVPLKGQENAVSTEDC